MKAAENEDIASLRDGYSSLAAWIALDSDSETLIFRNFTRLSARRLLHLQSQLLELESQLDELDAEARRSDDFEDRKSLRRHETLLAKAADGRTSRYEKKLRLLEEVHVRMNEYHETLLLESQIANLHRPRRRAVKAYKSFMQGTEATGTTNLIYGKAKSILDDEDDLIALRSSADMDVLSRFLQDRWPEMATRTRMSENDTTLHFRERWVQLTVGLINIVVAAALLIGAMIGLRNVETDVARLAIISILTVLFAFSVGVLTNAKRAEIFASTAAYSAVLVVFVSGALVN